MSSHSRRSLVVLVTALLALAAVAAGCGGEDSSEPPAAGGDSGEAVETQRINLLIDFFPNGNHALFYLAREQGFFADEGLEVDIRHILGGAEVAKSIIAGQAHFGYADLATMAVARSEQQADVRAIMGIQQQTPMAIVSRGEQGIQAPADLEGKKIVDFAGSSTAIIWPVFLERNGVDPKKVNLQMVDPGSRLALAIQKKVDGAIAFFTDNEPAMRTKCDCDVSTLAWKDHGIEMLSNGLIASSKYLEENPDVAERFVRAMQRALAAAGEDPEQAAQDILDAQPDLSSQKKIVVETVKNSFALARTEANEDEPIGYMADADWKATIELMAEAGAMEAPDDIEQFYTNEFISDEPAP